MTNRHTGTQSPTGRDPESEGEVYSTGPVRGFRERGGIPPLSLKNGTGDRSERTDWDVPRPRPRH